MVVTQRKGFHIDSLLIKGHHFFCIPCWRLQHVLIMTFKQQIILKVSSARKAKYSGILPMSERGYVQETEMHIARGIIGLWKRVIV
jgi:hypothetical protein